MTHSANIIGIHKHIETTNKYLGWGVIGERKACCSNRYYRAQIYKQGRMRRVKADQRINYIY
jgi:hypothetical protein